MENVTRPSSAKGGIYKMGRGCMEILCVETGQVFESLTSAAKALQVSPKAIRQAIGNKGRCKGYHFLYNATPAVNARNIKLLERPPIEELEITKTIRGYQREIEVLKEGIFVELFKSWYTDELTMDECVEISGYNKQYLYQKFRAIKLEKGLD